MRNFKISVLFALAVSAPSFAATNYSPTDLSGLSTDMVTSLVKTAAIGGDFRALQPATTLGMTIGFDLGVDLTAISVPAQFKESLALATGQTAGSIPATIALPRLNIHKGLPFGIDIGFSYIQYESYIKMYGADIKYALVSGAALPTIAIRGSWNSEHLWFMNTTTFKTDVLISKNFMVIDPYAGAGLQFWSGDIEVPTNLPAGMGLPATVSGHASGITPHFYGGLALKLMFLRITGELDYSTAGITTYGLKASLGF